MSILETKGLVKRFGPTVALDGMTLAVEPGRIVGLLPLPSMIPCLP